MTLRLYVGNLPYSATEDQLRDLFGQHGELSGATVIIDRETGRSRGFGFVEFVDDTAGRNAMSALDGTDMDGRSLRVNEARERESRDRGPRY